MHKKIHSCSVFYLLDFYHAQGMLKRFKYWRILKIPTLLRPLTLFLLRGPKQPKIVWHFHSFMTGVTKIHDFVCFSICLVPVKLFWEKKLWNFEKLKKTILTVSTPKGPPFGKKIKKIKFFVSFPKDHTISTLIWILHVPSFLLRYVMSVFRKIFIFSFFSYEISIDYHFHSLTSSGKNNHHRRLF